MITREQVLAAKEKFLKEHKSPVSAVGITRDENQEFSLYVTLEDGLPVPDGLPQEYDGIRVIYASVGIVEFHKYCGN